MGKSQVIEMIGVDKGDNLVEYADNVALDFLVATLSGDDERAHDITHTAMSAGQEFIHDFFSSFFFHIDCIIGVMKHEQPKLLSLIDELSENLKEGKGTNFWDTYAIMKEHPNWKINEKAKAMGREDDPYSYWKGEWR